MKLKTIIDELKKEPWSVISSVKIGYVQETKTNKK